MQDDVLVDADVPELSSAPTSEIVTLYNKLMLCSYPMNLAKRVVKVDGGVQNFLKFLHELRSVVSHCMHYSPPGLSTLEIKCSLLKLEKEKIQVAVVFLSVLSFVLINFNIFNKNIFRTNWLKPTSKSKHNMINWMARLTSGTGWSLWQKIKLLKKLKAPCKILKIIYRI